MTTGPECFRRVFVRALQFVFDGVEETIGLGRYPRWRASELIVSRSA